MLFIIPSSNFFGAFAITRDISHFYCNSKNRTRGAFLLSRIQLSFGACLSAKKASPLVRKVHQTTSPSLGETSRNPNNHSHLSFNPATGVMPTIKGTQLGPIARANKSIGEQDGNSGVGYALEGQLGENETLGNEVACSEGVRKVAAWNIRELHDMLAVPISFPHFSIICVNSL